MDGEKFLVLTDGIARGRGSELVLAPGNELPDGAP
jgi:hypothetical protein